MNKAIEPLRLMLVAVVLAAATACGAVSSEPYMLGRVKPSDSTEFQVGQQPRMNDPTTGRPYFSLCYSKLSHTAEQIRALVQKHCSDPQLVYNGVDLYSCSLNASVRASYSCAALSRTAEEARPNLRQSGSFLGSFQHYQ